MADRGITFSAPMVRALLEGRKTQTRRLLTPQPVWEPEKVDGFTFAAGWAVEKLGLSRWRDSDEFREHLLPLVRHQPGDRLYVREHWKASAEADDIAPRDMWYQESIRYLADGTLARWPYASNYFVDGRHRQAMHMPRWASRLTLLVTDVRVQRLQDISEADADAEGFGGDYPSSVLPDVFPGGADAWSHLTLPECYGHLWNSLHTAPGTRWEDNPWIYAVSFDVRHGNIDKIGGEA